jgi:hypothetical protein
MNMAEASQDDLPFKLLLLFRAYRNQTVSCPSSWPPQKCHYRSFIQWQVLKFIYTWTNL